MEKGLVDLDYFRKNKYNCDCRGTSGYCFIRGNKIIKIYATIEDEGYIPLDTSKVCNFSKFFADTIVFPDGYIEEDELPAGEISEYIKDKSIIHSFANRAIINSIIKHYESVIEDLYTFSNIEMNDLCSANILYSNRRGFHIIDTSKWQLKDNMTRSNIFRFNGSLIRVIFELIDIPVNYRKTYAFLDEEIIRSCNKYGKLGKELIKVLEMNINNNYRVLNLLYLYKDLYNKIYGEELKTLNDMQNFTKVLKKG